MSWDAAAVARALVVDAHTAGVATALQAAGVDPILLKGPSFQRWLYGEQAAARTYGDTDLLVDPRQVTAAEGVLADLGYTTVRPLRGVAVSGIAWASPAHEVDLHTTIWGWGRPATVWQGLQGHTAEIAVGGVRVRILDAPARAVHVATHPVQNSFRVGQANEDLARALAQVPDDVWRQSADLARALGAYDAWVLGLQSQESGRALCRRLGIDPPQVLSPELALKVAGTAESGAMGVLRVVGAPTWQGRVAHLTRLLFPPRRYAAAKVAADPSMAARWRVYPAYWRQLVRRTPGAVRAWRRTLHPHPADGASWRRRRRP